MCNDFKGFGTSAMDNSNGIFLGRPYDVVTVLIRKSIRIACPLHSYNDSRLLGITVKIMDTYIVCKYCVNIYSNFCYNCYCSCYKVYR